MRRIAEGHNRPIGLVYPLVYASLNGLIGPTGNAASVKRPKVDFFFQLVFDARCRVASRLSAVHLNNPIDLSVSQVLLTRRLQSEY